MMPIAHIESIPSITIRAKKFSPNLTMGHMATPRKRCSACMRRAAKLKQFLKRFKKGTRK